MPRSILSLFLAVLLLIPTAALAAESSQILHLKAKVIEILAEEETEALDNQLPNTRQIAEVEFIDGPLQGQKHELVNTYSTSNPLLGSRLKSGAQVLLLAELDSQGKVQNLYVQEPVREMPLYILIGLFGLAHVLVGGLKGLKALITLGLTGLLIFFVLVPLILQGYNPIPITILICFFVTLVSVIIVAGWNFKSWATIIGTGGGVMLAGLIAYLFGTWSQIIGLDMDEVIYLLNISDNVAIDFRGILFSGIIIGSLGAVMDVTISIASATEEIFFANPELSRRALFRAGMNVGKDIMGTMSNTLILAYVGTAIPLVLLFAAKQMPFIRVINADLIASEIIRAISGSIGLVSAIPLTAFLAATMMGKTVGKPRRPRLARHIRHSDNGSEM